MRETSVVRPAEPPAGPGPAILPLLRELGDLKRIRSAGREGSIATRLFVAGWRELVAGKRSDDIMARTVAAAVAAARLGDLDYEKLTELGLSQAETVTVLERAFDEVSAPLDRELAAKLRGALVQVESGHFGGSPPTRGSDPDVPHFVKLLAEQPRAGVTCPGRPRMMLEPTENHAEHCLVVAVYGVLAAPVYGADPVAVFLAGMGHHLHSAAMPDSGFTGEILLGDKLDRVIETAREMALAALEPGLAATMRGALAPIARDDTPEARAFHAGDVIDRVIEIEQHLKAAGTTMDMVLDGYGLVHEGPVKPFHDRVLAHVGLG